MEHLLFNHTYALLPLFFFFFLNLHRKKLVYLWWLSFKKIKDTCYIANSGSDSEQLFLHFSIFCSHLVQNEAV